MSPTSYQTAPSRDKTVQLIFIEKASTALKRTAKMVAGAGFEPTTFGL